MRGRTSDVSCIGVKGDTPYLAKTRQFSQNFARKPTASSSKKPCEGICHQCDAGGEDLPHSVPFEQLGVQEPVWLQTVGLDDCAEPGSPFRQIPSERDGTPGSFVQLFRYDLFHNVHLGVGKAFASSAVCMLLELFEGYSIGDAFGKITEDFQSYCCRVKESPYHKRLTSSLFGVSSSFKDCPAGGWNKGDYTRLLLEWFEDYCDRNVIGKTTDPVYLLCVPALHLVHP